nr:MAG TPA: hypothetical protein [Caudoviricetes sp.]
MLLYFLTQHSLKSQYFKRIYNLHLPYIKIPP